MSEAQVGRALLPYAAMAIGMDGVRALRWTTIAGQVVVETITDRRDPRRDRDLRRLASAFRRMRMRVQLGADFHIVPEAVLDGAPLTDGGWRILYSRSGS